MSHLSLAAKLATAAIALGLLAGCGRATAAAPAVPVIDSVFSQMPSQTAQPGVAKRQQDQRDQGRAPGTAQPGDDHDAEE